MAEVWAEACVGVSVFADFVDHPHGAFVQFLFGVVEADVAVDVVVQWLVRPEDGACEQEWGHAVPVDEVGQWLHLLWGFASGEHDGYEAAHVGVAVAGGERMVACDYQGGLRAHVDAVAAYGAGVDGVAGGDAFDDAHVPVGEHVAFLVVHPIASVELQCLVAAFEHAGRVEGFDADAARLVRVGVAQSSEQEAFAVAAVPVEHVEEMLVWFEERGGEHAEEVFAAFIVGGELGDEPVGLFDEFGGFLRIVQPWAVVHEQVCAVFGWLSDCDAVLALGLEGGVAEQHSACEAGEFEHFRTEHGFEVADGAGAGGEAEFFGQAADGMPCVGHVAAEPVGVSGVGGVAVFAEAQVAVSERPEGVVVGVVPAWLAGAVHDGHGDGLQSCVGERVFAGVGGHGEAVDFAGESVGDVPVRSDVERRRVLRLAERVAHCLLLWYAGFQRFNPSTLAMEPSPTACRKPCVSPRNVGCRKCR